MPSTTPTQVLKCSRVRSTGRKVPVATAPSADGGEDAPVAQATVLGIEDGCVVLQVVCGCGQEIQLRCATAPDPSPAPSPARPAADQPMAAQA
jgi:hypothetical protein